MTASDNRAVLVLEDGRVFTGTEFGAVGQTLGEAVFSTGMSVRVGRTHLRIPRWACPRVTILERWGESDARQHVRVEITAPIVGRVYEYAGSFTYSLKEGNVPAP